MVHTAYLVKGLVRFRLKYLMAIEVLLCRDPARQPIHLLFATQAQKAVLVFHSLEHCCMAPLLFCV